MAFAFTFFNPLLQSKMHLVWNHENVYLIVNIFMQLNQEVSFLHEQKLDHNLHHSCMHYISSHQININFFFFFLPCGITIRKCFGEPTTTKCHTLSFFNDFKMFALVDINIKPFSSRNLFVCWMILIYSLWD